MRLMTEDEKLRKATYIARATRHFDTPQIRREASRAWDEVNGFRKINPVKMILKRLMDIKHKHYVLNLGKNGRFGRNTIK